MCNLGTLCLTRKDSLGIALHPVLISPLPMTASPRGAPLPLERSEELELEAFSSPAVLMRSMGKGNPLWFCVTAPTPNFPDSVQEESPCCSSGVSIPREWEQQGNCILGTISLLAPVHPAALSSILTPKPGAPLLCLVFGSGFAESG